MHVTPHCMHITVLYAYNTIKVRKNRHMQLLTENEGATICSKKIKNYHLHFFRNILSFQKNVWMDILPLMINCHMKKEFQQLVENDKIRANI